MSNSLRPHGLYSPWNSPGRNTEVGRLSLLQGIFPTQGLNLGLRHCRRILYQLSHHGSPRILEWVANPFSSVSSDPGIKPGSLGSPTLQADSLPAELSGKPNQQTCPVIIPEVKSPSVNCSLRDAWADSTFTGGPQTPGQARRSLSLDTDAGDSMDTPVPCGHGVWGPWSVLEARL